MGNSNAGNTINTYLAGRRFYSHYDTYNPEKILDASILPSDVRANIARAMAATACQGLTGATLQGCLKAQPKPAAVHPPFTAGPSTGGGGTSKPQTGLQKWAQAGMPSGSGSGSGSGGGGSGSGNKVDDDANTKGYSREQCEKACEKLKEDKGDTCANGETRTGEWNGGFTDSGSCACVCEGGAAEPAAAPPLAATTPAATTPAATTGIGGGLAGIYNSLCASKIPLVCDSPANFKVFFVIVTLVVAFMVFRSVMRR